MDASSILSTLLSSSSIKGISKAAGTSTANVTSVLSAAVPSLLQGASKQASGSTAASFAQALTDHAQADTSNLTSFFKNADLTDGSKIVSHLLGAKANSTTTSISKAAGTDSATTKSVLSAAAPLLMSLLGQQSSGSSGNALSSLMSGLVSNNLGSIVGNLLGGGSSSSSSSSKPGASSLLNGLMGMLK